MNIEKRGKNYRIIVTNGKDENGKRIKETTIFRPDPGMSERQARKAAEKFGYAFEEKIKRGGTTKYDNMTFAEFAKKFFEVHAPTLKAYTASQYRDIYEKRLKPYFGKMKISNIKALDVREWLADLEKANGSGEPLSENSKGVYFRTLSSLLGVAVKWDIIPDNPCKKVTMPRKPQSDVKALQESDVKKLFSTIDGFENPQAVILVYIFLLTGIRESEAAGLQWKDIDFENNIIHISRECLYIPQKGPQITPPKSKASNRDIYIPELLSAKLWAYKLSQGMEISSRGDLYHDEDFLITQFDGRPVHSKTIRTWIKKAFAFCEVPYVTVHGLRHTYASLLIANGMDLRTTAAQLGHSSPALTMNVYANPQNKAKRKAADLIGNIFFEGTN